MGINKRPTWADRTAPRKTEACAWVFPTFNYTSVIESVEDRTVAFCRAAGVRVTITSRLRTCEEQAELFRSRRTKLPPTTSQHEFGMAFDAVPSRDDLRRLGATFSDGLEWVAAVARAFGAHAIAEGDHSHVQQHAQSAWNRIINARDVAGIAAGTKTRR